MPLTFKNVVLKRLIRLRPNFNKTVQSPISYKLVHQVFVIL